nr:Sua5/YciO/YrdC/YwlC family protein [Paludibacterium denitrificans]
MAPDMGQLGLLLPPAPLHWLLLHAALGYPAGHDWRHEAQPVVWVMTSANRSGAPTVTHNHAALTELADIADAFLLHDRDIVTRSDDSVLTVVDGAPLFHRRARGFAPEPLPLPHGGPPVLALGAYLKNTATLMCDHEARLSTHVGDLDHPQTCVTLDQAVERLLAGTNIRPAVIACDRQTDSYASQLAERLAEHWHVPLLAVQHHHAHLAAVMAEHALEAPALGLVLDGFGLGDDGAARGGELMQLEGSGYRHLGSLATLPLPGGNRAAREPWRMAVGLWHQLGQPGPLPPHLTAHPGYALLQQQLNRRFNCPDSSSLGRWFDAIAGLTGRCPQQHFEGEAAQQLEALAQSCPPLAQGWVISANLSGRSQLDLSPLARHLLTLNDATAIASLWHSTLIAALADWLVRTARTTGLTLIVLGGGCLANRRLHRGLRQALTQAGLRVYLPHTLPPGDGGISLGQAWIARQWWRATQRS